MGKYKVIAPTNVMPVAPGPVYAEGATFEVDERKPELVLWVAEQLKVEAIAPVKDAKREDEPKKEKPKKETKE